MQQRQKSISKYDGVLLDFTGLSRSNHIAHHIIQSKLILPSGGKSNPDALKHHFQAAVCLHNHNLIS